MNLHTLNWFTWTCMRYCLPHKPRILNIFVCISAVFVNVSSYIYNIIQLTQCYDAVSVGSWSMTSDK